MNWIRTAGFAGVLLLAGCDEPARDASRRVAASASAPSPTVVAPAPSPGIDLSEIDLLWPEPRALQGEPSTFGDVVEQQARWRAALQRGAFDLLEAELARHEREARAAGTDRRLRALLGVFADADLSLAPALDRWVWASPANAHARLARGLHWLERAGEARGSRYASDTAEERLDAMRAALKRARADFEQTLALDPGSGLGGAALLEVDMHASTRALARRFGLFATLSALADEDDYRQKRIAHVLATAETFAHSYEVQQIAAWALQPKWGGTRETLLRHVDTAAKRAPHPDFALLPSLGACLVADAPGLDPAHQDAVALHVAIASRYGDALHPLCWRERGSAESALGREEAALESFTRFRDALPHEIDGSRRVALQLEVLQRDEEAAQWLDVALQRRPALPALLCRRARLDQRAGSLEAAHARLERALEQNPLDGQCWMQQAQVLNAMGRLAEAERAANRALELASDDAAAMTELGFSLLTLQRWAEALDALDRAVVQDPERASAWYYRGITLSRMKRGEEAKASLDRALALRPEHAAAAYQRGLVRVYLLQDLAGAQADLAFATRRAPDLAQAWFELAGVLYRQRDCAFVPALREYERACAAQACLDDRVRWMRTKLDDPGLSKLCPGGA